MMGQEETGAHEIFPMIWSQEIIYYFCAWRLEQDGSDGMNADDSLDYW